MYSIKRKESISMTSMVLYQNENGAAIASDTWNVTPNQNKEIQKLFYNKSSKIIVGIAGTNTYLFSNPHLKHYESCVDFGVYMRDLIQIYNGTNIERFIHLTKCLLSNAVFSAKVAEEHREEFTQLIIIWFDEENHKVASTFLEIKREWSPIMQQGINMIFDETLLRDFNMNALVLGKYYNRGNKEHPDVYLSTLQHLAIRKIYDDIEEDKQLPENQRSVGGTINWATMNSDGDIEANF